MPLEKPEKTRVIGAKSFLRGKAMWRRRRFWGGVAGVVILFVLSVALFPPRWMFRVATVFVPGATYFVDTSEKVVALTVDDGPDAAATPAILNVLRKHDAQATFFLIGSRVGGNEKLLRKMRAQGHELGNHLTDDVAAIRYSAEEFESRMRVADRTICQAVMAPTHNGAEDMFRLAALRPGQGWYSREMVSRAGRSGYRLVLGSVWPYDTEIASPRFASWFILANARPGSIVVLHDTKRWGLRTCATLNTVLPELKRRGYRVVTVRELLEMEPNRAKFAH